MLVIISPRSDREATAGTLFQFIVSLVSTK